MPIEAGLGDAQAIEVPFKVARTDERRKRADRDGDNLIASACRLAPGIASLTEVGTQPVPDGSPGSPAAGRGIRARLGGIYRGWYNVLLAVIGVMVVTGTTSYSFGLFIKPVSQQLGLSRASTNLGLVMFHLGFALSSPFVGRLLDRFPILTVQRVGATFFGAGMVALGFASSPVMLAVLIAGPVAMGAMASGPLFANVLVTRWFIDLRARALTITAMGTSLGGMLIFPVVAALISFYSWRTALIVSGACSCLILWAISFLVSDRPPQAQNSAPANTRILEAEAIETVRLTPWEVLSSRDFWFIALTVCLLLGIDQALLATITPYVQDRGYSTAQAAAIMSALTGSAIGGKLLFAWIADRYDLRLLLALTAICGTVMLGVLVVETSYSVMFATACLTGIAVGGTFPLGTAMIARRFGAPTVGTALGLMTPLGALASMGTLYFIGRMYDRNGNYSAGFLIFTILSVLAMALMPFIRLPRASRGSAGC